MRTQKRKIAIVVLAVMTGGVGCVFADVAATVNPSQIGSGWPTAPRAQSIGWRFFVKKEFTITHLGLYDAGDDGLANSHIMGIWRLPNKGGFRLERQVTIPSGGVTDNHYVYVEVTPPLQIDPNEIPYNGNLERWMVGVYNGPENTDGLIFRPQSAVTLNIDDAGIIDFQIYTSRNPASFPGIAPYYWYPWGQTSEFDYYGVNFKYTVNRPPVADADSAVTQINTPVAVDVLDGDSDPDGDPLSIVDFTSGAHGTVMKVDCKLVYTPDRNFVGDDSFTYTISDGNGGTATATVSVTVKPGTITIDIKPGSYPNTINLGANGVIPVAILSSETFDATALDPETISLMGMDVAVRGRGNRYLSHSEDVNGDGRADLLVQFDTENLVPGEFQDGMATLTVATPEYTLYLGEDEITIVPPLP